MAAPLSSDLDHPEGVAWSDRFGLFAGGEAGQIYRVEVETGEWTEVGNTGGSVLGLAWGPGAALYLSDRDRRAVVRFDPIVGGEAVDVTSHRGVALRVPNYPAFDADGHLFVSDSGDWDSANGSIVRFPRDGGPATVVADNLGFANGIAFDPAQENLYVAESNLGQISRFAYRAGSLGPRELFRSLTGVVPDGLAFTASAELVVACYRPDALLLLGAHTEEPLAADPTGILLAAPTNIAFCGRDRTQLVAANYAARHLTIFHLESIRGAGLSFTEGVDHV
jgi:gluconolactonase